MFPCLSPLLTILVDGDRASPGLTTWPLIHESPDTTPALDAISFSIFMASKIINGWFSYCVPNVNQDAENSPGIGMAWHLLSCHYRSWCGWRWACFCCRFAGWCSWGWCRVLVQLGQLATANFFISTKYSLPSTLILNLRNMCIIPPK